MQGDGFDLDKKHISDSGKQLLVYGLGLPCRGSLIVIAEDYVNILALNAVSVYSESFVGVLEGEVAQDIQGVLFFYSFVDVA